MSFKAASISRCTGSFENNCQFSIGFWRLLQLVISFSSSLLVPTTTFATTLICLNRSSASGFFCFSSFLRYSFAIVIVWQPLIMLGASSLRTVSSSSAEAVAATVTPIWQKEKKLGPVLPEVMSSSVWVIGLTSRSRASLFPDKDKRTFLSNRDRKS